MSASWGVNSSGTYAVTGGNSTTVWSRRSGMQQDDLAELLALLQTVQRGRVVVDPEGAVDVHGQAVLDERADLLELLVAAHRRADDLELLEEQAGQVERHLRPGRAAADHQPPAGLEGSDGLLPRRRADALDDDVGLHRPRLGGAVVGRVGAHRQRLGALGRAAAGDDHAGPGVTGDRQGGGRDTAADADDEDGLAGAQPGAAQ